MKQTTDSINYNKWRVYQRGYRYRVGRDRWWGRQWLHEHYYEASMVVETQNPAIAQAACNSANERLRQKQNYRNDQWKVIE